MRKSNIEMLRVISMLMIISSHYVRHTDFILKELSISNMYLEVMQGFGKVGVAIFILITGYFLTDKKKMTKIINLEIKTIFYSLIGLLIGLLSKSTSLTSTSVISSILPTLTGVYWFITVYVLISLFGVYIYKLLNNLTKEQFIGLIKIFLIVYFFLYNIPKSNVFGNELIICMVYLAIGFYIKKFDIKFNPNKYFVILEMISMILIICLFRIIFDKFNISIEYLKKLSSLSSPITLLLAISIFKYFINIEYYSKSINLIAGYTLGVYLIHDNIFIREILWNNVIKAFQYSGLYLIVYSIFAVSIIYVVTTFIDFVFEKIIFYNLFKHINCIFNKEK